jgi:hypothetical protein
VVQASEGAVRVYRVSARLFEGTKRDQAVNQMLPSECNGAKGAVSVGSVFRGGSATGGSKASSEKAGQMMAYTSKGFSLETQTRTIQPRKCGERCVTV